MRKVVIFQVIGIALAIALLEMSEMVQNASAFRLVTRSDLFACTDRNGRKPEAIASQGVHGFIVIPDTPSALTAGFLGGKPGPFIRSSGVVCVQ